MDRAKITLRKVILICCQSFFLGRIGAESFEKNVVVEAERTDSLSFVDSKWRVNTPSYVWKPKKDNPQGAETLGDILESLPGVGVARQGAPGQASAVFMRGARSESTLVLLDGIELNDPMSPSRGFDFGNFILHNIERIEVYYGPQTLKFGSGALGGVINIVTKSGGGPLVLNYFVEAGSYKTHQEKLGVLGQAGQVNYSLGLRQYSTEGFSAAAVGPDGEPDGSTLRSAFLKLDSKAFASTKIYSILLIDQAHIELDAYGGVGGDNLEFTGSSIKKAGALGVEHKFSTDVSTVINFSVAKNKRKSQNLPDAVSALESSEEYLGQISSLNSNNRIKFGDFQALEFGMQWREETGSFDSNFLGFRETLSRKNQSIFGVSASYAYENDNWATEIGIRSDHSPYLEFIPSMGALVNRYIDQEGSKLYFKVGTGFKTPSLYQKYSSFGNESLSQEKSVAFELGIENNFSRKLKLKLGIYRNNFLEMIEFDTLTSRYFNLAKANSAGMDLQSVFLPREFFELNTSYGYLYAQDLVSGTDLLRRPRHTINLAAKIHHQHLTFNLNSIFKSRSYDFDPSTFERTQLSSYCLLGLGIDYRMWQWLNLGMRIENVFDKEFQEVAGYAMAGRSYFLNLSGVF